MKRITLAMAALLLVAPVAALAARRGVPVGLFGSDQASLEAAARALQDRCPGLDVAACIAPPMGFDPQAPAADALMRDLHASGARIVFLALAVALGLTEGRGRVADQESAEELAQRLDGFLQDWLGRAASVADRDWSRSAASRLARS